MKIYIATNGQSTDASLSGLGRQQTSRLGQYLNDIGFNGKIYSLPYTNTMETAEIVADFTNSKIIPWTPFGELPNETDDETLKCRLQSELNKLNLSENTLFVVHESALDAFRAIYSTVSNDERACNCSLSYHDTENRVKPFTFNDTGFLAYKMLSYDSVMKSDEDYKKVEKLIKDIDIPHSIKNSQSTKILHITDTPSCAYPYYKKLIDEIRPDIIIHTGDFVDEVKVGRVKNTTDEYEEGCVVIGDILTNSCAEKIYCVCGNNDVESIIKKYIPRAKFVEAGSAVDICGVKCALAHKHNDFTEDAQWRFYGHGLTGETWSADKNNIKSGACRFNGIWNISVITLPDKEIYTIPNF